MEITEKTRVSVLLNEYGDIAEVMEILGIKRVGGFSLRKIIARFITVKTAAKIHRVPLDDFLTIVNRAIKLKESGNH
ncbi:MAG: DUF1858 domain-containing protein [Bacteroidales bacterium]|nr:DUF1858 domain-containing protein [Bacteroidales bacterium]